MRPPLFLFSLFLASQPSKRAKGRLNRAQTSPITQSCNHHTTPPTHPTRPHAHLAPANQPRSTTNKEPNRSSIGLARAANILLFPPNPVASCFGFALRPLLSFNSRPCPHFLSRHQRGHKSIKHPPNSDRAESDPRLDAQHSDSSIHYVGSVLIPSRTALAARLALRRAPELLAAPAVRVATQHRRQILGNKDKR